MQDEGIFNEKLNDEDKKMKKNYSGDKNLKKKIL